MLISFGGQLRDNGGIFEILRPSFLFPSFLIAPHRRVDRPKNHGLEELHASPQWFQRFDGANPYII